MASLARRCRDDDADISEGGDEAFVDVYGNEVHSAVAEYTLDGGGTVYEVHSPRTELPRRGAPTS
jgi:hypothetical protein